MSRSGQTSQKVASIPPRTSFIQVRLLERKEAVDAAWHMHPEGQLFVVTRGVAVARTEHGDLALLPGRTWWVPPSERHSIRTTGPVSGFNAFIAPRFCRSLPRRSRVLGKSTLVEAILSRALGWSGAPGARERRLLLALVEELETLPEERLRLPLPRAPRLAQLAQTLLENPADPRTLAAWSRSLAMTRRTLVRRFRAETGLTFAQWRQQVRLTRALQLLEEQGTSVSEASLAVGYESLSAFIAAFRRTFGISPARYLRLPNARSER